MSTITAEHRVTQVRAKSDLMRKLLEWGGFAAGATLVAFGIVAIIMGFSGRATVADSLKLEKIVGSADMTRSDRQGSEGRRPDERRQHADR